MKEIKIVRLLLIVLAVLVLFLGYKYYMSFQKNQVVQISHSQVEVKKLEDSKENTNSSPSNTTLVKIDEQQGNIQLKDNLTKNQVEEIIHDYIMNNPQLLIDSTVALQNKKQQEELDKTNKVVAEKRSELEDISFYPYIGPKDASSKIIMFYDYNCSYCRSANFVLNETISKNSNLQVIYRPLPILGQESKHLAKIMLTVFQVAPTKFKTVHDELMMLDNIKLDDLDKILLSNNINVDENKALKENLEALKQSLIKSDASIDSTLELAKSIKMRGVPAFVINGKLYPGMMSYSQMENALESNTSKKDQLSNATESVKE